MKKRNMAMLMAVILVITSVPFTAFAEEIPTEVPAGSAYSWADLQEAIDKASPGDEIDLPNSVIASETDTSIVIPEEKSIILDLNGYCLDRGLTEKEAKADGTVIAINPGASLTLKDSVGGGMVTGGNNIGGGGGVYVFSRATFTMEGGTISGNKAKVYGGGVFVVGGTEAKVILKGGAITGNETDTIVKKSGAGIHFQGDIGSGGRLYVGGDAVVSNNVRVKEGEKITSNAWLADKLTIGTGENGVPKPTKDMSICIAYTSAPQPGKEVQFTENASSGDEKYFKPDNEVLEIAYNSTGYLMLQKPTLSVKSDKTSYHIGEQIRLTFETKFVKDGKKIVLTEVPGNTGKVPVKNGTAAITVIAETAGRYNYRASVEDKELNANVWVTVMDAPKMYHTDKSNTFGGAPVSMPQKINENEKAIRPETGSAKDDNSEPLFTGKWNNPVKNGSWEQDASGIWSYTSSEVFCNTWGYIMNPFAGEGQNKADWFYFDPYGHMLTGWQFITGKWYYLNPIKDGTQGACFIGPGKTPDGWLVDETGACIGQ